MQQGNTHQVYMQPANAPQVYMQQGNSPQMYMHQQAYAPQANLVYQQQQPQLVYNQTPLQVPMQAGVSFPGYVSPMVPASPQMMYNAQSRQPMMIYPSPLITPRERAMPASPPEPHMVDKLTDSGLPSIQSERTPKVSSAMCTPLLGYFSSPGYSNILMTSPLLVAPVSCTSTPYFSPNQVLYPSTTGSHEAPSLLLHNNIQE